MQTQMDAAEDLLRADTFGDAMKTRIDQTHDAAAFGTGFAHDRHLRAGVDEGFHVVTVDLAVLGRSNGVSRSELLTHDVEHDDVPEELRSVLVGMLHIVQNILHAERSAWSEG